MGTAKKSVDKGASMFEIAGGIIIAVVVIGVVGAIISYITGT